MFTIKRCTKIKEGGVPTKLDTKYPTAMEKCYLNLRQNNSNFRDY